MIAPLPQTDLESAQASRHLHKAHRLIASTLLKRGRQPADRGPPVPAWKAWLLTVWGLVTTGVYFLSMIGRL